MLCLAVLPLSSIYYFPDFNPEAMAKVLELINSGTTELSPDVVLRTGMISIIQSLQININLEPATRGYTKMTSQNMPRNMDDLIKSSDKIKKSPQKMPKSCDKSPMMSQKMCCYRAFFPG